MIEIIADMSHSLLQSCRATSIEQDVVLALFSNSDEQDPFKDRQGWRNQLA